MEMQDHEKWIKDTFSEERVPLDTHALFQDLKPQLPKKKNRYGLLWILALPIVGVATYFIFPQIQHIEVNSQLSKEEQQLVLTLDNELKNDNGSSPKEESTLHLAKLDSKEVEDADEGTNSPEDRLKSIVSKNEKNTINNRNTPINTNENLNPQKTIDGNISIYDEDTSVDRLLLDQKGKEILTDVLPLTLLDENVYDQSIENLQSNSNTAAQTILESEVEAEMTIRELYTGRILSTLQPTALDWSSVSRNPLIQAKKAHKTYISLWAQASLSSNIASYNTGTELVDELYRNISLPVPSFQIDLGASFKLNSNLKLNTSIFYRSIVQSMKHSYVVISSTEREGIKQLVVDTNGNSNPNNGTIEVVQLRQYTGTWYQFLNQSGVNINLTYSKAITSRAAAEFGMGISASLMNQNKGSYITEELAISAIENNLFNWNPTISVLPSLGYTYAINQKIKAGIQLHYYNTQTTFSNQQFSYNVFNIGLNCSYKL